MRDYFRERPVRPSLEETQTDTGACSAPGIFGDSIQNTKGMLTTPARGAHKDVPGCTYKAGKKSLLIN